MAGTSVARVNEPGAVLEAVIASGDLERLTPEQRTRYYVEVCQSIGLNPLTQPFQYIRLNNKLTLYATKGATDQIRNLKGISVSVVSQETMGDLYVVTVEGKDSTGRVDSEVGVVTIGGLRGDNAANAIMKAVTKAKRRLTLSMAGLGLLDESELETTPAVRVSVDASTGEILPATSATPAIAGTSQDVQPIPSDNAPSQNQLRAIAAKSRNLGMSRDELRLLAGERYGVGSANDLTKSQASDLIDHLKGLEEAALPEPPMAEAMIDPGF